MNGKFTIVIHPFGWTWTNRFSVAMTRARRQLVRYQHPRIIRPLALTLA